MNEFLRDHLEDYLSGTLSGKRKAEVDAYLAANPQAAEEITLYADSASLFQELRVEPGEAELGPEFYARVMQRIDEERSVPFWSVFLQPAYVRQLAFGCLLWFALLGAYVTMFDAAQPGPQLAESIVTEQPPPEYNVRMGTDLAKNRGSMLAVLISARD